MSNSQELPAGVPNIRTALRLAFDLGQKYSDQANSDSYRDNRKAEATRATFDAYAEEVAAEIDAALGAQRAAEARQAEVEALRADAVRYRWLREQHEGKQELSFDAEGLPMPLEPEALAFTVFMPERGSLEPVGCIVGELDAAIDAAIAASKE